MIVRLIDRNPDREGGMTDWRTIDSAPTDIMILVYADWVEQVRPAILKSGKRGQTGWYVTFSGSSTMKVSGIPRYWMPLPDPPSNIEPTDENILPENACKALERMQHRASAMRRIGTLFMSGQTYDQIVPQIGLNRNQIAGIIRRLGLKRGNGISP